MIQVFYRWGGRQKVPVDVSSLVRGAEMRVAETLNSLRQASMCPLFRGLANSGSRAKVPSFHPPERHLRRLRSQRVLPALIASLGFAVFVFSAFWRAGCYRRFLRRVPVRSRRCSARLRISRRVHSRSICVGFFHSATAVSKNCRSPSLVSGVLASQVASCSPPAYGCLMASPAKHSSDLQVVFDRARTGQFF